MYADLIRKRVALFQSLTGRLKTGLYDGGGAQRRRFQSLTGRLKTELSPAELREKLVFQSLTGRLKTNPRTPLGAGF